MESKKRIHEVRNDIIFQLARTTPDVLRGRFPLEHLVWEMMEECNTLIVCLVTDQILKEETIMEVIMRFDILIDVVCDYLDGESQIRLAIYWMSIVNAMKSRCEEEDQFEACSNIKTFIDEYFISIENDDNMDEQ